MKPWIKAGIAGGILQIIFTLPSFAAFYLPAAVGGILSLFACCLFLTLYPLPGVLDVHWTAESRTEGKLLLAGALAGLLATAIDSVATLLMVAILSISGGFERYLQQTIPNEMEIFEQTGMDFLFSTGGLLVQTGIGLIFHVLTGVVLSALGALIYAGLKNKNK
jgi:hypothetical protein